MKALGSFPLLLCLCVFAFGVSFAGGREIETRRAHFVSGGHRISVETFAPAGATKVPAVLVLHSAAGTIVGKGELVRFSRALAEQGKIAFLVRYFDRTGTIFAGDKAIDEHTRVWTETVQDAVEFVAQHPRTRPDRIGMFGFSLGAYLSVAVGTRDPRIDAVAEIAGGIFEGSAGGMRRFPPMLILHGRADQRVPVQRAFELQQAARRFRATPELRIYEGEGHRLSPAASADASGRALAFLDRHLGGSPGRRK
ncbi:MAG TPA: prolyl oligopeptidase family serine peptidase [Chthoniobacteraceae bacterium]|jgi:dipeptidyl aminopeptidase/acylaminoacyl peptidase